MSTATKIEGTAPRVVVGRLQPALREERSARRSKRASTPGPSRVALMLALAHGLQRAIDRGAIRDQVEAARQFGVTSARMSQLLDLTLLAPTLQETVLRMKTGNSAELVTERALREVLKYDSWALQEAG